MNSTGDPSGETFPQVASELKARAKEFYTRIEQITAKFSTVLEASPSQTDLAGVAVKWASQSEKLTSEVPEKLEEILIEGEQRVNAIVDKYDQELSKLQLAQNELAAKQNDFESQRADTNFRDEIQELSRNLKEAQASYATSLNSIVKLQQQLSEANGEQRKLNDTLQGKADEIRKEYELKAENSRKEYDAKIDTLRKEYDNKTDVLRTEHNKKVESFMTSLATQQSAKEATFATQQVNRDDELKKAFNKLSLEFSDNKKSQDEKAASAQTKHDQEKLELKKQIKDVQDEKQDLARRVRNAEKENEKLRALLHQAEQDARDQVAVHEQDLESKLAQQQGDFDLEQNARHQQEIRNLNEELDNLRRETAIEQSAENDRYEEIQMFLEKLEKSLSHVEAKLNGTAGIINTKLPEFINDLEVSHAAVKEVYDDLDRTLTGAVNDAVDRVGHVFQDAYDVINCMQSERDRTDRNIERLNADVLKHVEMRDDIQRITDGLGGLIDITHRQTRTLSGLETLIQWLTEDINEYSDVREYAREGMVDLMHDCNVASKHLWEIVRFLCDTSRIDFVPRDRGLVGPVWLESATGHRRQGSGYVPATTQAQLVSTQQSTTSAQPIGPQSPELGQQSVSARRQVFAKKTGKPPEIVVPGRSSDRRPSKRHSSKSPHEVLRKISKTSLVEGQGGESDVGIERQNISREDDDMYGSSSVPETPSRPTHSPSESEQTPTQRTATQKGKLSRAYGSVKGGWKKITQGKKADDKGQGRETVDEPLRSPTGTSRLGWRSSVNVSSQDPQSSPQGGLRVTSQPSTSIFREASAQPAAQQIVTSSEPPQLGGGSTASRHAMQSPQQSRPEASQPLVQSSISETAQAATHTEQTTASATTAEPDRPPLALRVSSGSTFVPRNDSPATATRSRTAAERNLMNVFNPQSDVSQSQAVGNTTEPSIPQASSSNANAELQGQIDRLMNRFEFRGVWSDAELQQLRSTLTYHAEKRGYEHMLNVVEQTASGGRRDYSSQGMRCIMQQFDTKRCTYMKAVSLNREDCAYHQQESKYSYDLLCLKLEYTDPQFNIIARKEPGNTGELDIHETRRRQDVQVREETDDHGKRYVAELRRSFPKTG